MWSSCLPQPFWFSLARGCILVLRLNPNLKMLVNAQTVTVLPGTPKRVGIAADHGGYELKQYLAGKLREAGHEVVDFGDGCPKEDDDYPDFIVPLARAVAAGTVKRGIGICGSGVGATVCANKVAGV